MRKIQEFYGWARCGMTPRQFWLSVCALAGFLVCKALAWDSLQPEVAAPFVLGLGDLFGSERGTTQTQQKSEPWSAAQPYLTDYMKQARNLYYGGAAPSLQTAQPQLPSLLN